MSHVARINIWERGFAPAERIKLQMQRRIQIRQFVESSPERRAKVKAASARDPISWINDWVWTCDPRNLEIGLPANVPFDLWPKQLEFANWIVANMQIDPTRGRGGGVVEKHRDAGATWIFVALWVHAWLYRPGFIGGLGSRKGDLVDKKGDPDSLFEKARFIIRFLPPWMLPRGFVMEKHAKTKLIINPENGSVIRGEEGDNIGRGGRSTAYLIDEAAKLKDDKEVDASLSHNCRIQFWLSTPSKRGMECVFAKKRHNGRWPVFVLDWRDDPRKSQEWYEAECENYDYDPDVVARELDRSYVSTSEQQAVPGEWIISCVEVELPPHLLVVAGLDVADSGNALNVWLCRAGPSVIVIHAWSGLDTTDTTYRAIRLNERYGVNIFGYDSIGVGAGVTGTINALKRGGRKFPYDIIAVNVGDSPSKIKYDDRPAQELFRNLKAELWWRIRRRAHRTHRFMKHLKNIKEGSARDEAFERFDWRAMLSIPKDAHELINQLALPRHESDEGGRTLIESKKSLARRGIKSPDHAEALTITEACFVIKSKGDWMKQMVA